MAAVAWTDEETLKLIELWSEETIQVQLEGCKRNMHVYQKISRELGVAGYERTAIQCRDKLKKLRAEYKKVKDNNDETGRRRKKFKFYDELNEVLGCKPATCPPVVIDTSDMPTDCNNEESTDDVVDTHEPSVSATSEAEADTNDVEVAEHDSPGDKGDKDTPDHEVELRESSKPKKKRKKENKMDKTISVIEELTESLKESDNVMLQLEEKRMKFDEKLIEMEYKRSKENEEREERQRREER